jgi:hypothetical protein
MITSDALLMAWVMSHLLEIQIPFPPIRVAASRAGDVFPLRFVVERRAFRYGGHMCYTCGCKLPYEDHGDPRNIVEDHLENAGKTEAIEAAGAEQAKKNMLELLEIQSRQGDLGAPKADYN